MRGIWLSVAVMLIGCCCAQEVAAQSHPLSPVLPNNSSLGRMGLTRMWWGTATMDAKRDHLLSLTLDDNYLFAHASNGILCCFDSETGRKLWAISLGGQDEPAYPPTSNDKYVMILSGSILYAIKKQTGDLAWQFPISDGPTTPPVIDDEQVYFATTSGGRQAHSGSMQAFDLTKLGDNFASKRKADATYRAFVFRYTIPTPILETPVVLNKNVAFSGSGRTVTTYVLGQDRTLKYSFDTPSPVSCGLAAFDNMLFVCSSDSQIYGLNMTSGALRWQSVLGGPVSTTPAIVENDIYVCPDEVGMRKFEFRTGHEKWSRAVFGVTEFLAVSRAHGNMPGHVYGSDKSGNLIQMQRSTGKITGRMAADRYTIRVRNELTDRVYMGTRGGVIIALREKGQELPVYFRYPDRLPILPEFAPENAPAEGEAPAKEEMENKAAAEGEAPAKEAAPESKADTPDAPAKDSEDKSTDANPTENAASTKE